MLKNHVLKGEILNKKNCPKTHLCNYYAATCVICFQVCVLDVVALQNARV